MVDRPPKRPSTLVCSGDPTRNASSPPAIRVGSSGNLAVLQRVLGCPAGLVLARHQRGGARRAGRPRERRGRCRPVFGRARPRAAGECRGPLVEELIGPVARGHGIEKRCWRSAVATPPSCGCIVFCIIRARPRLRSAATRASCARSGKVPDDRGCAGRLFGIMAAHEARTQGVWRVDAHSVPKVRAALQAQPAEVRKELSRRGHVHRCYGEETPRVVPLHRRRARFGWPPPWHRLPPGRRGSRRSLQWQSRVRDQRPRGRQRRDPSRSSHGHVRACRATHRRAAPSQDRRSAVYVPTGEFGKSRSDDEHLDVVVATLA